MRLLGIPTETDRFIQQAIAQVLTSLYDPTFSDHSYGFRPKRSAHDAVRKAKGYLTEIVRIHAQDVVTRKLDTIQVEASEILTSMQTDASKKFIICRKDFKS